MAFVDLVQTVTRRLEWTLLPLRPHDVRVHEVDSQEEVWNVVEGKLAITTYGQEHIVGPGCTAIVPANTRHSTRALAASRAIVVDHPVRDQIGGIAT